MKKLVLALSVIAIVIATVITVRAVDIQNFSVTLGNPKAVVLPRWTIQAKVTESDFPFTVLHDFTGANAIEFPEVINTLSPYHREQMIHMLSIWLVRVKAGLEEPPE